MARRWQIDVFVEPVSTSPESVHVDAWMQPPQYPAADTRTRRYLSSGATGPGFTGPEAVHVEAWRQPEPQPQRNWAWRAAAFAVVLAATSGVCPIDPNLLTQKEVVSVDKFQAHYPDMLRLRDRDAVLYQNVVDAKLLTLPETVRLEKFKADYPDIVPRLPVRDVALLGQTVIDPKLLTTQEQVSIDKFGPDYPSIVPRTPVRDVDLLTQSVTDPRLLTQKEAVSIDKFGPHYPDWLRLPVRDIDLSQSVTDPNLLTQKEQVSVDKFGPDYPSIVPRTLARSPELLTQESFVTVVSSAETVTIDKWNPDYPSNVRIRKYGVPTGAVQCSPAPAGGEQTSLDKWFEPASLPTWPIKRDAALSQNVTDPKLLTQPESVSIDKWEPAYPDRIPARQRASEGYFVQAFTTIVPEVVTLDKWFEPASVPTRLLARTDPGEWISGNTLGSPPEVVTIDKWFEPASLPTWPRPRILGSSLEDVIHGFSVVNHIQPRVYFTDEIARPYPVAVYEASGSVFVPVNAKEAVSIDKFGPHYADLISHLPLVAVLSSSGETFVPVVSTFLPRLMLLGAG